MDLDFERFPVDLHPDEPQYLFCRSSTRTFLERPELLMRVAEAAGALTFLLQERRVIATIVPTRGDYERWARVNGGDYQRTRYFRNMDLRLDPEKVLRAATEEDTRCFAHSPENGAYEAVLLSRRRFIEFFSDRFPHTSGRLHELALARR